MLTGPYALFHEPFNGMDYVRSGYFVRLSVGIFDVFVPLWTLGCSVLFVTDLKGGTDTAGFKSLHKEFKKITSFLEIILFCKLRIYSF